MRLSPRVLAIQTLVVQMAFVCLLVAGLVLLDDGAYSRADHGAA